MNKEGKEMNKHDIIKAARDRFDALLHEPEYQKILADDSHRETLVGMCDLAPGREYLDLGTGNGFIAWALARREPGITVRGLDIARAAIEKDNELAKAAGLERVAFDRFDGSVFPYPDGKFHGVVSRYAFHHFPDPAFSLREITRVSGEDGYFLLADPTPAPGDSVDFINRYQHIRADGHVRYYSRDEIRSLAAGCGFHVITEVMTTIRYPQVLSEAYQRLIRETDKNILDLYAPAAEGDQIFLTVDVMNILFRKQPPA